MKDDLVSRQWLLNEYDRQHKGPPGGARKIMEEAPAVDAEPVRHGRWIETRNDEGRLIGIVCNQCHNADNPSCIPGRYCWFCGAKMDGGTEDGLNA